MSYMSDLDIQRRNAERLKGPLSMSEADLAALEEQGRELVADGKLVRSHLTNCYHGDQRTLNAMDRILKYAGIFDQVAPALAITQPTAEMACHHEE